MNRRTPYKVPLLRKDCSLSTPPSINNSPRLNSTVLDPSAVVVRLPGQAPQTPLSDSSALSSPNQHPMLSIDYSGNRSGDCRVSTTVSPALSASSSRLRTDMTSFTGIDCDLPFDIPISDSYFYGDNAIWDVDAGGSMLFPSDFQPNLSLQHNNGSKNRKDMDIPSLASSSSTTSPYNPLVPNQPFFNVNNVDFKANSINQPCSSPLLVVDQANRHSPNNKKNRGMQSDLTLSSADDDFDADQAELRRQIHIQSEQRRRAQIKDGFEDLRKLLPSCHNNRKISKAVILSKAVMYIEQLKASQLALAQELQRLQAENDEFRAWQQKQVAVLHSINAATAGSGSLW